jgi:ribulose-phosphate 3-epimerase
VDIRISPSILNADLSHLSDEVARIPSADFVHLDVMDNHFVPNLTFGLPVVANLRASCALPMDVHLMIDDADRWAPSYAEIGCESVTFHIEAAAEPVKLCRTLRGLGAKASVAFKPATGVDAYAELLPEVDQVLIMTVEPGFGGQSFMEDMLAKIRRVRELIRALDKEIWIEVDGGVNEQTVELAAAAGANVFVAGSAAYRNADPDQVVQGLRARAERAFEG